jgi:PAS domain S-box-containing protein
MGDWSWDSRSDVVIFSERAAEMFGVAAGEGLTWAALKGLIHPDDVDDAQAAVDRSIAEQSDYAVEYRVRQPTTMSEVWVSARGRAFYDGAGQPTGMFGVVEDITTRKEAEKAERLLIREVDHRAKNIMAVVQSLVRLTPFNDKDQYVEALSGRINTLSRVHSLLSRNRWLGASLSDLIRQELTPYTAGRDQFTLEGPPVEIKAEGTQPLSLIFHELTTNATKPTASRTPKAADSRSTSPSSRRPPCATSSQPATGSSSRPEMPIIRPTTASWSRCSISSRRTGSTARGSWIASIPR